MRSSSRNRGRTRSDAGSEDERDGSMDGDRDRDKRSGSPSNFRNTPSTPKNPFRTSRLEILSSEVKVVIEEGDRNSNSRELESKRKLLLKLERSLGEEEME